MSTFKFLYRKCHFESGALPHPIAVWGDAASVVGDDAAGDR
jgi:hypothetical protein